MFCNYYNFETLKRDCNFMNVGSSLGGKNDKFNYIVNRNDTV